MIFTKPILYLEVYEGTVKATELLSGNSVEKVCSGLSHPRTLLGEFVNVENCFTELVMELCPKTFFRTSPIIYIHLFGKNEGGYTNVEVRAFFEAAASAGGKVIKLIDSKNVVSKELLLKKQFSEIKVV